MKNISILFLTYSLNVGGTENHLFHLISNLNKNKFTPVVCCLYNLGPIGEKLLNSKDNIKVYHNLMRNKWDIRGFWRLMRIFRNEKVHLLFMVNSPLTLFYGIVCAIFKGVNARITRMTATNPTYHVRRRIIINKAALPFLSKIITQAPSHKENLINHEGYKSEKMVVIYNGVDLASFDKHLDKPYMRQTFDIPANVPVIGIVARLAPEKGHTVFLEASRKIINELPDAHFIIVGDGPERGELEDLADSLAINSNVHFLGARMDIPRIIALFDVAVLSSNPNIETFSNSILEYMAVSKPIVSTNVGSIAEQIQDGETGFLIPSGDSDALANAVLSLLKDENLAKKMGKAGRERVKERFSIERMTAKYEDLFANLVKQANK